MPVFDMEVSLKGITWSLLAWQITQIHSGIICDGSITLPAVTNTLAQGMGVFL